MKSETSTIQWTLTDEAPALASFSLLPIVRAFLEGTGIRIEPNVVWRPETAEAGRRVGATVPGNVAPALKMKRQAAPLNHESRAAR